MGGGGGVKCLGIIIELQVPCTHLQEGLSFQFSFRLAFNIRLDLCL